jgi:hypothetical protein
MLLLGANGSGKTGALASLAQAGYNIRIVDMDNGCDALSDLLGNEKSPYGREALSHVIYETITDPMRKSSNGKLVPAAAKAWDRAMELINDWGPSWKDRAGKPLTYNLGPLSTWTEQDVLVIDSLTMLGNAAMNKVLMLNSRLGQAPHQSDWYGAQQFLESFFQLIFDEGVQCNVIINCHIKYIGEENGPQVGYPDTPGRALSPKMGTYFNTILLARSRGTGALAKRKIITRSTDGIELKSGAPLALDPEYDLADGLARIFAAIRASGAKPVGAADNPTASASASVTQLKPGT